GDELELLADDVARLVRELRIGELCGDVGKNALAAITDGGVDRRLAVHGEIRGQLEPGLDELAQGRDGGGAGARVDRPALRVELAVERRGGARDLESLAAEGAHA